MILNRQRRVRVAVKPLEAFVSRARWALRLTEYELTVCLVSDAAMARMNLAFRGKPGPTDVLSFPAAGTPFGRRCRQGQDHNRMARRAPRERGERVNRSAYLGDIAIAPEAARRNARRLARALACELRILILHGMLHLAGYDHETDRGQMDRLEHRLRRRLGLS